MTMETPPPIEKDEARLDNEPTPEEVATMEVFEKERAGMITRIFEHKITQGALTAGLVLAPGTDVLAFATFAAEGKTLSGKPISPEDRVYYAAAGSLYALSYVLASAGFVEEGITVRTTAIGLGMVNFGPELIEQGLKIAKKLPQGISSFMEKTRNFIRTKPSVVEEIQHSMGEFAGNDPDLNALN